MSKVKFVHRFYFIIFILVMISSISFVYGTAINVNVADVLDTTTKEIECCQLNNKVMVASYDVFNSGSVAHGARIRLDVFDKSYGDNKTIPIWSAKHKLNPGQRETINLYWYEPSETIIVAKPKLYRAYEIIDLENITWDFNEIEQSELSFADEGVINLDRIHVYDNKITVKMTASGNVGRVIVYPIQYTKGWLFEQTVVDSVIANKTKVVPINYETGMFYENEITLVAVSLDGRYYGEQKFLLKKETGLKKWFNLFVDMLN